MAERKPIKGVTIESTEKLIADTLSQMPEKAAKKRAPHVGANEPSVSSCAVKSNRKIVPGVMSQRGCAYAGAKGVVHQVVLHLQVVVDELGRVAHVGHDSADPGRCHDDHLGALAVEKRLEVSLSGQVEFVSGAYDHVRTPAAVQQPADGRSHHAPVSGNVYTAS